MSRLKIYFPYFLLFLLSSFLLIQCSDSGSGNKNNSEKLLNDAWVEFESENYNAAKDLFMELLNNYDDKDMEASEGLGWCYLMLGKDQPASSSLIDSALTNFEQAAYLVDANAGKCIIYHARGLFSNAVDRGLYVLDKDSTYSFVHYPSVDATTIRLIVAMSAFNEGDMAVVVNQLKILDPSKSYDANKPDELLEELKRLWKPVF